MTKKPNPKAKPSRPPDYRVNIYEMAPFLREETRKWIEEAYLPNLWIYVQDPLVAKKDKRLGLQKVDVLWEPGLGDGPTSARLVVVDFDADTCVLHPPAQWNEAKRRFETPESPNRKSLPLNKAQARKYQFHQVNVWATVQNILEMFEDPTAFGRRLPWGFDGNRLIIVPHAGYKENAYYCHSSKSLQFYYYGDPAKPKFTCLSHDIVAHETGHAILDGIRPYYYNFNTLETGAFHEFFADITAMLTSLRSNDVRRTVAVDTDGNLKIDKVITDLAEQFGNEVHHTSGLRNLASERTMDFIQPGRTPHDCSLILTGAIFDILVGIVETSKQSSLQNLWDGTKRIIRMALQPIDFLPPVDVNFADYVQAFWCYYNLFEPTDSPHREEYAQIIREAFEKRKLWSNDTPKPLSDLKAFHLVDEIVRSRVNPYHFLHANRSVLHIPQKADFKVLDLYECQKYGRGAKRLPRQIVIQYVWSEEVLLEGAEFGILKGKMAELFCGGTLVLDSEGNILSWMHKPGSDEEQGETRKAKLREHISSQVKLGRVGLEDDSEVCIEGPWTPGIMARTRDGLVHLEITPRMRKTLKESPQVDELPMSINTELA